VLVNNYIIEKSQFDYLKRFILLKESSLGKITVDRGNIVYDGVRYGIYAYPNENFEVKLVIKSIYPDSKDEGAMLMNYDVKKVVILISDLVSKLENDKVKEIENSLKKKLKSFSTMGKDENGELIKLVIKQE
jgi:riboflavin synthase alpha subunit